MAQFHDALNFVLKNEGGIADDPNDNGKTTNKGISLRFLRTLSEEKLRKYGIFETPTSDTVLGLSDDQIIKIYEGEFWDDAPFEKIQGQLLCNRVFDMCVNSGLGTGIKCLQLALKPLLKDEIKVDGILGKETLNAVNSNPESWIITAFRNERAREYKEICESHPEKKRYLNDWLTRAYR